MILLSLYLYACLNETLEVFIQLKDIKFLHNYHAVLLINLVSKTAVEQKKIQTVFLSKKVFSISVKGNFFKEKTFYKGSVRIKLIFLICFFIFIPSSYFTIH